MDLNNFFDNLVNLLNDMSAIDGFMNFNNLDDLLMMVWVLMNDNFDDFVVWGHILNMFLNDQWLGLLRISLVIFSENGNEAAAACQQAQN